MGMKEDEAPTMISRRTFLCQAGIVGLSAFIPGTGASDVLRPPGAGPEFLARCIRCGKCGEACPFDCIRFLDITGGILMHTPYIDPLKTPCYLCREVSEEGESQPLGKFLRCGEACPTGALELIKNDSESLSNLPDNLRIGVAELDNSLCVAWQFGFCGECYFNCPMKDKALLRDPPDRKGQGDGLSPYVDTSYCIGCGVCTFICPVREDMTEMEGRSPGGPGYFEERYGGFVKRLLNKRPVDSRLPAVTVRKRKQR